MGSASKNRIHITILAILLPLLLVAATALGILLLPKNQEKHPTVQVALEAPSDQTPAQTTTETTQTVEATTEAVNRETVPAAAQSAPQNPASAAPSANAPASAPNPGSTVEATLLRLHSRQEEDNIPFAVTNMFPGDSVTRYYCVRVSHSQSITLHYRAEIRSGGEKLAEVLKVCICLPSEGETLYDGLMADMPKSLDWVMSGSNRSDDMVYEITVYLDTSVGNDYQDKELMADFYWWVEDDGSLEPPQTGDGNMLFLWAALAIASLLALIVMICLLYGKQPRLSRLMLTLVVVVLALSVLSVTAYAATRQEVSVMGNLFHTGTVDINLNDGKAVTDDEMFTRFEPGMNVTARFFIENNSTDAVYYKLYMRNVEGTLADVLQITVTTADGSRVLYSGGISRFTRSGVGPARMELGLDERQELIIWFYFPESAGNAYQAQSLTFELCADAVQTKNNPNGDFE